MAKNIKKQSQKFSTEQFLESINNHTITVGVIGLGYVGLPIAVEYAKLGISTIGFDIDNKKIDILQSGGNYIMDIDSSLVASVVAGKNLQPTTDFSRLAECDVIYICVPTPFTPNKDPDISYIIQSSEAVADSLRLGQLIILKSTTFPGTTTKYVQPILEKKGLIIGKDFFLAFSPERIDPGNTTWHTGNTPIVAGGVTKWCTTLACAAHGLIVSKVIPVSSPNVAEMEKLLENIFRSVNIALVNELAQLCDRIGVNIWEVVEAAGTKPFGFMPFFPGPGIGGHCILIDIIFHGWQENTILRQISLLWQQK